MNPQYLFVIEGKSSNLLCPFDVTTLPLGYESDYIPIENTGYQVLVDDESTPSVLARVYNRNKVFIADVAMTIGEYVPFATLYSGAVYVKISFSNVTTPDHVYFGTSENFDSWWNNKLNPIWGNDLSIDYTKDSQQQFFRRKLSGKLTFVREDYDYIRGKSVEERFVITIYKSDDNRKTWEKYWSGYFCWSDCEFNEDDKYIKVTPSAEDVYTGVVAALEKEYNLIDLLPSIQPINLVKRPIIQMYIQSAVMSPRVTCFLGANYWEQDCEYETSINKITRTCHFYLNYAFSEMNISVLSGGTVPDPVPETNSRRLWKGAIFSEGGNDYWKISYSDDYYTYEWRQGGGTVIPKFVIYDKNTSNVKWIGRMDYTNGSPYTIEGQGGLADLLVSLDVIDIIYARLLTDLDRIGAEDTYDIPADDIISDNRNYKKVLELNLQGYIAYTDTYSSYPTKWGRHSENEYFKTPQSTGQIWKPISPSAWIDNAYWLGVNYAVTQVEQSGNTPIVLKNAYSLEEAVSVLLKQAGTGVSLKSNSFISYKADNVYSGVERKLFITPKSNVTKIMYDIAAQVAPISLKQIFDMLRDCYRAYWFIDENKELHIEQIEWFMNGGGYPPFTPDVEIDLTERIVTRNGKEWSFSTNKYTFDKPDMPERYEFSWMDDESEPFNGEPINMISNFVEKSRVEKITIQNFSSDVDYIMANPDGISPEGFVLMAAELSGDDWVLPLEQYSEYVYLQNAYCAFGFLYLYYAMDLPSARYRLGEGDTQYAGGIKKTKIQEVSYPSPNDPDMMKLVKTSLGYGQFEKLSINLSSRNGKATLKYNPYE